MDEDKASLIARARAGDKEAQALLNKKDPPKEKKWPAVYCGHCCETVTQEFCPINLCNLGKIK